MLKHKQVTKGLVLTLALLSSTANAALINRGGGMIYDDVLDITWLQDANFAATSGFDVDGTMNWTQANAWATNLVYGGYSDWRLPSLAPTNGTGTFNISFSFDGSSDRGFNNSSTLNELGYMFYVNLSNTSFFSPSGIGNQPGSQTFNSSFIDGNSGLSYSFDNIGINYWTGIANDPFLNAAWAFNFRTFSGIATGETQLHSNLSPLSSWVVRDGDVANSIVTAPPTPSVPEPGPIGLLAFGLLGFFAARSQARSVNAYR